MLAKFSADMQMKHALTFTSFMLIFSLHTSHRRIHLKMEPELNKPDIILNCEQMHPLKLVLSCRNISCTAARNAPSAEYAYCQLSSLPAA